MLDEEGHLRPDPKDPRCLGRRLPLLGIPELLGLLGPDSPCCFHGDDDDDDDDGGCDLAFTHCSCFRCLAIKCLFLRPIFDVDVSW